MLASLAVAVASSAAAGVPRDAAAFATSATPARSAISAHAWPPVGQHIAPPHVGATHAAAPQHRVVTLVTGDRVQLTQRPGGRTTASLLPGSPSIGKPVNTMSAPGATYVEPKMRRADRLRLDISVFNVARLVQLSKAGARIPLVIRFAKGSLPHDLPGITVSEGTASKTKSGQTAVRASYSPGSAHLAARLSHAWDDVATVALPQRHTRRADANYVLHTLTVNVLDRKGNPARFAEAWVQNVLDGRLFTAPVLVLHGVAKVSVPEGPYSVMAGGFQPWVAIAPQFKVTSDRTVTLDARGATSRPSSSVRGTKPLETTLTLQRAAEGPGSFTWALGSDTFNFRVTPVRRHLPRGTFTSLLGATLVPRKASTDFDVSQPQLVSTKDARLGVPKRFIIRHQKSDFAILHHRYFANGPRHDDFAFLYGFSPIEFFAFISGQLTTMPSARTVWLQGSPNLQWLQALEAFFTFPPFSAAEMDAPVRSYSAGETPATLPFLRGPVGPGFDRGINGKRTGRHCLMCRDGNELHGAMPIWSSSDSHMAGFVFPGKASSWSLTSGRRRIQRGAFAITPHVTLPSAAKRYTLTARVRPHAPSWQLSTDVRDVWGFTSRRQAAVVPLLMARYVPTNDLSHYIGPGRAAFRLDFDNLGPARSRVVAAKVEFSVNDGRTWDSARLRRLDANSFRVSYTNPRRLPRHRYVTLRVSGKDAAGRTVEETATRAYRLTKPKSSGARRSPSASATPALSTSAATASSFASVPNTSPTPTSTQRAHGQRTTDPGLARDARPACEAGGTHRYRCFTLIERSGRRALTRAGDPAGWGALDLRDAYDLTTLGDASQTVAVVVAFDYPSAEADLNKYRRQFGLPACTSATGCFTKINQNGRTTHYPYADQGWALEAALDLQMISASCPRCKIVLVEAKIPVTGALNQATDAAVAAGADVINHSYGIQENGAAVKAKSHYATAQATDVASSGDAGYGPASFPASSPDVVSVGGTVLHRALNARGWRENAWSFAGSGCSAYFAKPAFQRDAACGMRTFADLSTVSDGLAVYDSFGYGRQHGWFLLAGTSASSPFVSGLIGAAGAGGLEPSALYADPGTYRDIDTGRNGFCRGNYICTARAGYDGPTGWGTPRGLAPFLPSPLR